MRDFITLRDTQPFLDLDRLALRDESQLIILQSQSVGWQDAIPEFEDSPASHPSPLQTVVSAIATDLNR